MPVTGTCHTIIDMPVTGTQNNRHASYRDTIIDMPVIDMPVTGTHNNRHASYRDRQ